MNRELSQIVDDWAWKIVGVNLAEPLVVEGELGKTKKQQLAKIVQNQKTFKKFVQEYRSTLKIKPLEIKKKLNEVSNCQKELRAIVKKNQERLNELSQQISQAEEKNEIEQVMDLTDEHEEITRREGRKLQNVSKLLAGLIAKKINYYTIFSITASCDLPENWAFPICRFIFTDILTPPLPFEVVDFKKDAITIRIFGNTTSSDVKDMWLFNDIDDFQEHMRGHWLKKSRYKPTLQFELDKREGKPISENIDYTVKNKRTYRHSKYLNK